MKVRKLVVLTLTFTLLCGSVAYADSVTQKLRVLINKKWEEGSDGVIVDNKTYISSQLISDKLQAIVISDDSDKKVTIYKPNVHMSTVHKSTTFREVQKDQPLDFNVFITVDSLKVDISALKLTIADTYGAETTIWTQKSGDSDFPDKKYDFGLTINVSSYTFAQAGPYTLRFWMKPAGESAYQVVSEKVLASK
ncbi:copper amine oxidase [Cohnella cholangitidis]|uniref:Copper amine oxidase n=1 Tax=Cohnella cholangitidis TaxID=2598458 RepID=A0A7G5BTQ0_9BACL|nr:copper amine oxidase [Cohnella cholangitidis]QMV40334.1 copper amine oxidase [Cohnella cholangitidis]